MRFFKIHLRWAMLVSLFFAAACRQEQTVNPRFATADFSSETANEWFQLTMNLVRTTPGYTPPVAAHTYGLMGIALYESVVAGMPTHQSLDGQLLGLSGMPKADPNKDYYFPECANAALSMMAERLFPTASADYKQLMALLKTNFETKYSKATSVEVFQRSKEFGESLALALYSLSATDPISHEAYNKNFPLSYTPPVGADSLWEPTPPAFRKAMQPYWGSARTFTPNILPEATATAPPPFSKTPNSYFYNLGLEVRDKVNNSTSEEKDIAKFWSDDPAKTATPSGHWISIARQILTTQNSSLNTAAETYAKVGIAVSDAFICCWKTKYETNLLRPVTYIKRYIDPNWLPLLDTPPFPEYTSGHSTQSTAAAQMLSNMFGNSFQFTDNTHQSRTDINGTPRTYSSFEAAAKEAAESRLLGGIHYRTGNEAGETQGKKLADKILSTLKFRK